MFLIILYLAKISNLVINLFKLGSGLTWPGHLALKLYPKSLKVSLDRLSKGYVLIAGTNGKTTTSKLIAHALQKQGLKVVSNKSGANLLNGILSAVLLDMGLFGKPKSDIGVFEADEFILPSILSQTPPRILLLLNLSRDQLDRYGEIDIIFDRWLKVLKKVNGDFPIVADISQEEFKKLPEFYKGKTVYFNESINFLEKTKLTGKYNAKNLNACLVVCSLMGFDVNSCAESLSDFNPAYGRGEEVKYKNQTYKILLAKNPASFNNNLSMLLEEGFSFPYDSLVFILNDNIPDGRDVSWIYDVSPVGLQKVCSACSEKNIFIGGTRCYEMATRLRYAGAEVLKENIFQDLPTLLKKISASQKIVVLPNYSAMLEFRKLILGRSIL